MTNFSIMKSLRAIVVCVAVMIGCQPAPDTAATAESASVARPEPQPQTPIVISEQGIGAAAQGMTVGEVRAALPSGTRMGDLNDNFMVDVIAWPVIAAQDTLYYLLFGQGSDIADSTHLELVATLNKSVTTAEGVGPGTLLTDAAGKYGAPTLRFNTNDESREYAVFPNYPGSRVHFRVTPGNEERSLAGTYETVGEYNETSIFDPAARILMIMVDVRPPVR
ncbi:MAG TPA: hypothetical protein VGD27_06120 [Longimicrobiales bacterium]